MYKEIIWNLEDEMQRGGVHHDLLEINKNALLKKLVKSVEGHISEVDCDVEIELNNGETIIIHNEHTKFFNSRKQYIYYFPKDTEDKVYLDMQAFLDNYCSMGMIVGALRMYMEHKLGLKFHI